MLWGLPGTRLSREDTAPRSVRGGETWKTPGNQPRDSGESIGAVVAAFLEQLTQRGIEVSGPGGISFQVRVGGGGKAPAPKRRRAASKPKRGQRKRPRRR